MNISNSLHFQCNVASITAIVGWGGGRVGRGWGGVGWGGGGNKNQMGTKTHKFNQGGKRYHCKKYNEVIVMKYNGCFSFSGFHL